MARYTSSRTNLGVRLGGLILAIVGAFSFVAVWHGLKHAGSGVRHNPWAAALVILGVVLVIWSFRDHLLGAVGMTTPRRAHRLIRGWLDTQHYTARLDKPPPDFTLTMTDEQGRQFVVFWQHEPFEGVVIGASWGVGAQLADVWSSATAADLRQLRIHLMDVGRSLEGGGASLNNLEDAATFQMLYLTAIPRDLINYEEFFRRTHQVQGCLIMAINYVDDLHKTLLERQEGVTPLRSHGGTSASGPQPGR